MRHNGGMMKLDEVMEEDEDVVGCHPAITHGHCLNKIED